MKRLALLAVLLIAAAPGGSDGDPASYRLRVAVQPAQGGGVQRLDLPAQVLAASLGPDLADLRVFDARGRAMPISRAPVPSPPPRRDTLPALPILGPADGLKVTGMMLRLDDQGRARLAEVDGTPLAGGGASVLLGALLDARAIGGVAERLAIDADMPAGQPVTFAVEASRDLKTWRSLGEEVSYRGPRGDQEGGTTIVLGGADLRRDWLRVTWRTDARLLSPIAVRGATLLSRPGGDAATIGIDASVPRLADAHTIDLIVPFATPIATLRITPTGDDVIVPVRILGRQDREQPWTLLATGTARRDAASAIALPDTRVATLRIEADARTPGFTAPPALHLGFAPRAIAFLAAGTAPFVLATGHATATDPYLPLATLTGETARALPDAGIAAGPAGRLTLDLVDAKVADRRNILLWTILLAATGLLGAMAWLLWRRTVTSDRP